MIKCDYCNKRAKYNIANTTLIYEIDDDDSYTLTDDYLENAGDRVNLHLCQQHYDEYWQMEGTEV